MRPTTLRLIVSLLASVAPATCGRGSSSDTVAPIAARAVDSTGLTWLNLETAHARLHFADSTAAGRDPQSVARVAELAVAANAAWLGAREPGPRLNLFFVASREAMRPFTGGTTAGLAVTSEGTAFFVANDSVHPALRHETMHLLAARHWGEPHDAWMQEGLATLAVGPCIGYTPEQIHAAARDAGLTVPLDSLHRAFVFAGERGVIYYMEGATLMSYIDRRYGRDKLRSLWASGLDGVDTVLGISRAELERDWNASLANVRAPMTWPAFWTALKGRGCE